MNSEDLYFSSKTKEMKTKEIIDADNIVKTVEALKALRKKVVLVMGCYDMLHCGHVRYLKKAQAEGDILIVAADSDELTKRRKGPQRPVVPEDERIEMLLGLECVDYVIKHEINDDIDYLPKLIRPSVLVISRSTKDYEKFEETLREKLDSFCAEIVCFEPQAETSTSAKIAKIVQTGNFEKMGEFYSDLKPVLQKHGLLNFEGDGREK